MRILALSPHPDDIELNAGGFLMKHKEDEIHVVYFSDCGDSLGDLPKATLFAEAMDSFDLLGATANHYTFDVRRFNYVRQCILDEILEIKDEFKPDLVLIPSASDIHQDHQVIHEEAVRAFRFTNTLAYGSPKNCRSFNPNYFVKLNKEQAKGKQDLINCYKSQIKLRPQYFNHDYIISNLRYWGGQCGSEYAEAFEVITQIEK